MHPPADHRWLRCAALAAAGFLLTACQTVQPWERGTLADRTMRGDRDPLADAQRKHIFFSRESPRRWKKRGRWRVRL